jgi:cellulose/xylan binding protein with CBM9 domain
MRNPIVLAVALSLGAVGAGPAEQGADAYECRYTPSPIIIDGDAADTAWREAIPIDRFYVYQPEEAEVLSATKARLLWDEEYLYALFECADKDVWSYSAKADDSLWNGDVAELFLKPHEDQTRYYEFVIAPNGTLYDARYPSRGSGGALRYSDWSSKARIATRINGTDDDHRDVDTGCTIEMALPWSALSEEDRPQKGDTWRFGVFRYDYSRFFEDPLLLMSIPEAPAWGFHYYEGYLPLVFRERAN